jgi:hypothetical protein
VSWTGFEPSELQTQNSELPERFDMNATCFPLGENTGVLSERVVEMNLLGGGLSLPWEGISMRQILDLLVDWT